jgi:uncharacterized RDD family membrane protein YckC
MNASPGPTGAGIPGVVGPYAKFSTRFVGALVDAVLLLLVSVPLLVIHSREVRSPVEIVIGAIYGILLVGLMSGTVGNYVARTRVVRRTGALPGLARAAVRWFVLFGPGVLIGLVAPQFRAVSLVWAVAVVAPILFSSTRQGLHDRASGVFVVDVDR